MSIIYSEPLHGLKDGDHTSSLLNRLFFVSNGSGGLTNQHLYYRETTVSTPIDLTLTGFFPIEYNYVSVVASPHNASISSNFLGINILPCIVNLPQISSLTNLKLIINIKDELGSAETNNITINAFAGDTIDGETSITLNLNYQCVSLYSNLVNRWSVY